MSNRLLIGAIADAIALLREATWLAECAHADACEGLDVAQDPIRATSRAQTAASELQLAMQISARSKP